MKEIYDEGRVIGLSSHEMYIRQLLSTNPEAIPMSEREWLASTVSESNSMILKVAAGTTAGYHDYALPNGSDLCGATMIHAYMFEGEVQLDTSGYWAISVDSYGRLISNTGTVHPTTPGTSAYVPTMSNPQTLTPQLRERAKNYLKIVSGLVIQPGEWTSGIRYTPLMTEDGQPILTEDGQTLLAPISGSAPVEESTQPTRGRLRASNDDPSSVGVQVLTPDFSKVPFVRIAVSEPITADVYIFLHGFVYKSGLRAGVNGPVNKTSTRPQDGDFLGPTVFPWACPIMFNVTTNVMDTMNNGIVFELVN